MRRAILLGSVLALALAVPALGHTAARDRAICTVTPNPVAAGESVTTTAANLKPGTWGVFIFDYGTQLDTLYAEVVVSGSKAGSFTMPAPYPGSLSFGWEAKSSAGTYVLGAFCDFIVTSSPSAQGV